MSDDSQQNAPDQAAQAAKRDSNIEVKIKSPQTHVDFATIMGLVFAFGLIAVAIFLGQSGANFLNVPALMIVVFGTMAVTTISYTGEELIKAIQVVAGSLVRDVRDQSRVAREVLDIANLAKKRGILALSAVEGEVNKDPFLAKAVQMVADGFTPEYIDRALSQEIDTIAENHRRAAGVMRRASEIAPGMGLIGTLVGLVQMLAQLDDPSSIGPAMAVALLTTFYGAILGTVVLGPLAAKLDRNANDEITIKTLIGTAMVSIAKQENPRGLEILINSILPAHLRIKYFD